jgi:predicted GH43/DUF377 family glycosyl hydrolase
MTKAQLMTRRHFTKGLGATLAWPSLFKGTRVQAADFSDKTIAPFRTQYRYPKLILEASKESGAFDSKSVDDPFVFYHDGMFQMLYIGFDGTGYQTGLARSKDLLTWERVACVARRDPNSKYTRYNIALSCLLRDHELTGSGRLKKVHDRYLGAWNAYPNAGYEEGAAVIGLAWSDDLMHWELTEPILFPQDGAAWEHGGLYRPNLIEHDGVYYLYYNAKTDRLPKAQGGGWHEQTGVATSRDLKNWVRYPGNPILPNGPSVSWDERFASNPFVVHHKDKWAMYYFGLDAKAKARELLALGDDLTHFAKVNEIMIDTGAPGSIDETYAHKPCVLYHDGALYHFYCAVSHKWSNEIRGIGVASSQQTSFVRLFLS